MFIPLPTGLFSRAKGMGTEKGKNYKSEGTLQANNKDVCREEMHPESSEREVLKNHHDMWFLL